MIFADAYFLIALLNDSDSDHGPAVAASSSLKAPMLTTEFVLFEVGNALSGTSFRRRFVEFAHQIDQNPWIEIVWSSPELVWAGVQLYSDRPDKRWSLTDCISFIVMKQRGITHALTHDHHFKQAGFHILL
ncbi:MAG TPA: PIN domain-containing protein [Phycisphaerae bacterium]|nr:PIN domain-containing protein [Phycisphaerae bacterium]